MEQKDFDIYEILKGIPDGTPLYSPLCGNVDFNSVAADKDKAEAIWTEDKNGEYAFDKNGRWMKGGEVLLFPSKEMRDWSKFFKKGDVLVCYEGNKPYYTVFDCFESNTYKDFKGKFAYDSYEDKCYQNEGNLSTNTFHKLSIADSEIYITKIEERFGGKLNLEALEIEKNPASFTDGDVVFVRLKRFCYIEIFNYFNGDDLYDYASLSTKSQTIDICGKYPISKDEIVEIRLATDSEKKQLFEALAKEGKVWDAESKAIVDLKPKCEFKPFDRCIWKIRNCEGSIWQASFVSYVDEYGAIPMGVSIDKDLVNLIILPYNEETAKLIGTTDDWKGGEG